MLLHELISADTLCVLKNSLTHVVDSVFNKSEDMWFIVTIDKEFNVWSDVFRKFGKEHFGLFVSQDSHFCFVFVSAVFE